MLGPLTTAITSMDEDKFFLTDNRKPFETKKYAYLGTSTPGFLFGLIGIQDLPDSVEAQSIDRIQNSVNGNPAFAAALRQVKELRNLGATVKDVSYLESLPGYQINYINGDVCDFDNSTKYSSSIKAVCDDSQVGFGTQVINKSGKCSFEVVLYSKFACPICQKKDLVAVSEGMCGDNNLKVVTYEQNNQTKCLWLHNDMRSK